MRQGCHDVPCGTARRRTAPVIDDEWLETQGREHGLTLRESQVLALITDGLTNLEIAEATYLSINSVKTYIRTAYRKIGVNRRAQAVAWGMTHGYAPSNRPTS